MTPEELDKQHEDDRADTRRSFAVLAFIAVFVAALIWLVGALQRSNQTTECIAAGHHDCVPLDTSGTAH